MKSKPHSHKQFTRFKSQTQDDHCRTILENLNKSIYKERSSYAETEEEKRLTNFYHVLIDCDDCTPDFALFYEITYFREYRTLSLVLHQKDKIADKLVKALEAPSNNALDAILKLIEAFASDLDIPFREFDCAFMEFYPNFFTLIKNKIMDSKDLQEVGKLFQTLLNLVKIMKRSLAKDPVAVYKDFCQFLVKKDSRLQKMIHYAAAICFDYFLRNLPDKKELLPLFSQDVLNYPEIGWWFALVFYEPAKNRHQPFYHLDDSQVSKWNFGAQMALCFMKAEKKKFAPRFKTILPLYAKLLEDVLGHEDENIKQGFYETVLSSLLYAIQELNLNPRNSEHLVSLNTIWGHIWGLLDYHYCQVSHMSLQIAQEVIAAYSTEELVEGLTSINEDHEEFLMKNLPARLKRLRLTLCEIISAPAFNEHQIFNAMQLLLKTCRITMPHNPKHVRRTIKKLTREARDEVVNQREETIRRKRTFTFYGILTENLPEVLEPNLDLMLPSLIRNLHAKSATSDLRELVSDVIERLREKVGEYIFDQLYVAKEKELTNKKLKRKQEKYMEAVMNPERFATRKIKKGKAIKRKRSSQARNKSKKMMKST